MFKKPMGIGSHPDSNLVLVADETNVNIQAFLTTTGAYHKKFETDPSSLTQPSDLAIDGDGKIYVPDIRQDVVKKFSAGGIYIATIGSRGTGDGGGRRGRGPGPRPPSRLRR